MPLIIGYLIGKAIGNLIVAIVSLAIRLIRYAFIAGGYTVKYTYIAVKWILGKLWDGGRMMYENYKLNYR